MASQIRDRFDVVLQPLDWHGPPGEGYQVVPEVSERPWFQAVDLSRIEVANDGEPEPTVCPACGVPRWDPLNDDELPLPDLAACEGLGAVAASVEWFGSGMESYRILLFERALAELLAAASPRDFAVLEPGHGGGAVR